MVVLALVVTVIRLDHRLDLPAVRGLLRFDRRRRVMGMFARMNHRSVFNAACVRHQGQMADRPELCTNAQCDERAQCQTIGCHSGHTAPIPCDPDVMQRGCMCTGASSFVSIRPAGASARIGRL